MAPSTTRRRLLAVLGTGALAGCTDSEPGDGDGTGGAGGGADDGTGDGGTADGGGDADGTDGGDTDGSDGGDDPDLQLPDAVVLEPVVEGLTDPLGMAVSPDDDLQYVLEQSGRIHAVGPDGRHEEPALDLTDAITTSYEEGLLGLALHPEFATNRRAFVRYSSPPREGTPDSYDHTFVLAEFEATEDGRQFRRETERTLLELPEPQFNHNAGDLAFGPDGLLYVPTGDGGGANDQGPGHVEDWYDEVSGGNGQDVTDNRLGGILRIDVDDTDGDRPYGVPEDNPLVGREGHDEYYAWGLRNPWRLSFDVPPPGSDGTDGETGATGEGYVADVGQAAYEEVNRLEAGANYGWNVREGAHCFQAEDCPESTPADVRGGEQLVDPVIEYSQDGGEVNGVSVIGGYVYRGEELPDLAGAYVFGDLQAAGRLFASRPDEEADQWPIGTISIEGASVESLRSFGRGADGELYAVGIGGSGGTVWRIGQGD